MKVLVLADVCNPEWPSLPIVGYQYAKALAKFADVTVVTQIRNKPNIEKAGFGTAKVDYLDTEYFAAPIAKAATFLRRGNATGWTIQMAMDYPACVGFELTVWQKYKRALKRGDFDVVHRITPMSPTLPSPMAGLSPVPFLLGPLNGNLPWPPGFGAEMTREREWLSKLREAYRLMPFYRSTYRESEGILAAFKHTMEDLPRAALPRAINFPEVGIHPGLFSAPERTRNEKMTVLYAGRLVPYKLPDVPVRAFAKSPILRKHKLLIVGEGPERAMIERIVRDEKLEDCVQLLGNVPQPEVAKHMRTAEIFAFPSIRELGAGVLVEAMACGLACVAVDYGAPGTLVGPDRGVTLPLASKDALVASMTTALEGLVQDPDRVERLGKEAHAHAMRFYPWEHKAKKTLEIYEWLLGRRPEKPSFWATPSEHK